MSATQTFFAGLLILIVFFWYFATDSARRRRILGTVLTLLIIALSLEAFWPEKVIKQEGTGPDVPEVSTTSKTPSKPQYTRQSKINLGLDLQGGTSFLIRLEKETGRENTKQVLDQAVEVIRKRVDKFGVSEPVITPEGTDRILVQIPGLDAEKIADAREQLKKVAKLEFRLVHPDTDRLIPAIEAGQAPIPPGYRIETMEDTRNGQPVEEKLLIHSKADIEGKYVSRGSLTYDQKGYGVSIQFTSEGGALFGELTQKHVGERFAILLDGKIQSAPSIREPIWGGSASITGHFTQKEAQNLANVLENPLSVPVVIEEERSASSTLGGDAIRSGIYAGLGGLALVVVLVALYYRLAGLVAILALIVNVIILLGIMGMFNFVLTLPGIAGIILTIGLAVDANVLIFERLREELTAGKPFPAAIQGAYSKAFTVIFDANVTTLITAAILFWYAAGPVKGFSITLIVGVIASVFTAMIVGRNFFDWGISSFGLKGVHMHHLISDKMNIDFLGKRHLWIGISIAVMVASIATFAYRGEKNFGIDFKGGDLLVLQANPDVTEHQVRAELEKIGLNPVIQKEKGVAGGDFIRIRSEMNTADKIEQHLLTAMPNAGFAEHQRDHVGTLVGGELARNSAIALGLGILGILLYVTARFEFSFAIGAVVALLHDVIITVGVFSMVGAWTGRELSLVMVGAILTIAGYSINDTIVVYDRIREGLHSGRKGTIQEIMNASINETLSRTLITSTLTFLSVAALFFFGGATLNDFALAILIGVVVGTYSSIFIASPIVLWSSRRSGVDLKDLKKKGESPAVDA
ncbi:MAG: protein translocase subunit SecD [Chthoniobacteraceae bacterium]|nr:protein translocase subunit SecD [Chthoniobacteraceae bacterium]